MNWVSLSLTLIMAVRVPPERMACSCVMADRASPGPCSWSIMMKSKPAPAMISVAIGLSMFTHAPSCFAPSFMALRMRSPVGTAAVSPGLRSSGIAGRDRPQQEGRHEWTLAEGNGTGIFHLSHLGFALGGLAAAAAAASSFSQARLPRRRLSWGRSGAQARSTWRIPSISTTGS